MKYLLSASFTFSIFGLYFINFMLPSMEWQPHVLATSSVAGFCIGNIGVTVYRFFEAVSDIRIALETRRRD